ncbi:hypothetical protein GLOIN_2v1787008 [Rhizophagus irregularis DAOM 181602=DAOM 197198]|uniref:Uncharacterized protein n=1 Tax=Rhizophagus irregularis (strain DAOM 181602 / DAOM 197198 / MUCL 43194) TaxID=747089 RepID=A0A2P4P6T3_RHIID|nr:hypothetical protein GLOIN_2v1787008 [Rhizophagus irregularis DAOM 181602=DAOM 197198]POG61093.1 hypothetical protein GLOIN_2v1787008 [Rhizophagus irregularis DAOM 181602=DAOM 197198]|eukprot:XP_025167959.1 hypothetical protein GLOIN_2v1787008 [Rhizophagus irregularis DAOM 181602=DAOM 197198]
MESDTSTAYISGVTIITSVVTNIDDVDTEVNPLDKKRKLIHSRRKLRYKRGEVIIEWKPRREKDAKDNNSVSTDLRGRSKVEIKEWESCMEKEHPKKKEATVVVHPHKDIAIEMVCNYVQIQDNIVIEVYKWIVVAVDIADDVVVDVVGEVDVDVAVAVFKNNLHD